MVMTNCEAQRARKPNKGVTTSALPRYVVRTDQAGEITRFTPPGWDPRERETVYIYDSDGDDTSGDAESVGQWFEDLEVGHDTEHEIQRVALAEGWSHAALGRVLDRAERCGMITRSGMQRVYYSHPVPAGGGTNNAAHPDRYFRGVSPVHVGLVPECHVSSLPVLERQTTLSGKYVPVLNGNNGSWTNTDDHQKGSRSTRKNKAAAKAVVLKGAGDYTATMKQIGRVAGRAAAQETANLMGVPSAGPALYKGATKLGDSMVKRIQSIFKGRGGYVTQPAQVNSLITGSPAPHKVPTGFGPLVGDASVEIKLTEALFTVFSAPTAGAYVNYPVYINPANPMFQFLSLFASNFEYVEWCGLVFEFESTCSPFVTGSALGTVISGMEYNPTNPLYTTAQAHRNSDNAIYSSPDKSHMYGVECAALTNPLNRYNIRNYGQPVSSLTDLGVFQLGLQVPASIGANVELGVLKASYHVRLSRARPSPLRNGYSRDSRSGASAANPLGSALVVASAPATAQARQGSLSQGSGISVTNTTITFPSVLQTGDVISVKIIYNNGTAAIFTPASVTLTNLVAYNGVFGGGQFNQVFCPNVVSTTHACALYYFQYTGNGAQQAVITFGTGGTVPANATVDVICNVELGGVTGNQL